MKRSFRSNWKKEHAQKTPMDFKLGIIHLNLLKKERERKKVYILFTHQQTHFLLNLEKINFTLKYT